MREWIVILEATSSTSPIDREAVRRLVHAVAAMRPGALYSTDRYALQVYAGGETPTQALATALHRWHQEVSRIGGEFGGCTLARVEVLTPEEYELEHDPAGHRAAGSDAFAFDSDASEGDELLRRALSDPVTGLPGRELFADTVDRALIGSDRRHLAVLAVHVEGVATSGTVFDRTAHEVWQRVAARIVTSVRPGDTTARLGADQFGVLLEDTSEQTARLVAGRLAEVLHEPLAIGEGEPRCLSAAVGVAMSGTCDALELVHQAGLAARRAKEEGGDRVGWFGASGVLAPDWAESAGDASRADTAAYLAMLTEVARAANGAATLEEAAGMSIKQVCAHTGWPAGRLCQRDGDELHPTDVRWISSPQWSQRWPDALGPTPQSGGSLDGRVTKVVLARPTVRPCASRTGERDRSPGQRSGEPLMALSVPVLVGSEVAAVLEFLADRTVKPDDVIVELLASVGIQLGRVVERERTRAVMRRLNQGEVSGQRF
jgi:diguanylate cyclase (GGDEF)-like protein